MDINNIDNRRKDIVVQGPPEEPLTYHRRGHRFDSCTAHHSKFERSPNDHLFVSKAGSYTGYKQRMRINF
jgi:hypothetical protein